MKKKNKIIFSILFFLILLIGTVCLYGYKQLEAVGSSKKITFKIEKDDTYKTVFKKLKAENIIKNEDIAYYYTRLFNKKTLVSGTFVLDSNQNIEEIVSTISNQNKVIPDINQVTLVGGKWAKDYAEALEEATSIKKEVFLEKWNNKEYIKSLQKDYWFIQDDIFDDNKKILLEGYLAPETYYLDVTMNEDDITRFILNQTKTILDKYKALIEEKKMSINELLTKASIVQFEANSKEDMQIIAQVIENRLNINQKLEVSVSICYSLYDNFTDWHSCEKNSDIDSPYNTYQNQGLPPGPIDNPSEDAIYAVLNPIANDYYFFVGDICGDQKIHYATTYEEHLKNVEKYVNNGCLQ